LKFPAFPKPLRWLSSLRSLRFTILSVSVLLTSGFGYAQNLTGTVTNGTTHRPASGDDVILLKLGQGMEEAGRTKADAKGAFSFKLEGQGPHLVRVVHQGVTYHRVVPPGSTSADVQVYDVAKKVAAISVTADVFRFQAQANELQGVRIFAVNNTSDPPVTQMNDQNFEFYLPEGAGVDEGVAKTEGGQPLNSAPVPQKQRNRYAFVFPLRPGETQFQVVFHVPYTGQAKIDPQLLYPAQHFVVMTPKTMQFSPATPGIFQSMADPGRSDSPVQVASNTQPGQPLAFTISGTGALANEGGTESPGAQADAPPGRDSRPGGGLGPPIDAPDPLEKYRWYILGGFAAVFVAGAVYIAKRSPADLLSSPTSVPAFSTPKSTASSSRSSLLLEALKEELFQLEVDHKQGKLPQPEYEKAKAALDQTLERALKRSATTPS
jgi:hypothetical protein